ncbi:MAG TPA: YciI family protein [Anaerolineae bacterium]|nr:YciI family protein [Anaerolineae bacterium]
MEQYLYQLRPTRLEMVTVGPTAAETAIVSEHFAHLEQLTNQGVMLLMGRTQDNTADTFGIAIFQAESEDQARAIMGDDPAVKNGIMRAKLFPFRIALHGHLPLEQDER